MVGLPQQWFVKDTVLVRLARHKAHTKKLASRNKQLAQKSLPALKVLPPVAPPNRQRPKSAASKRPKPGTPRLDISGMETDIPLPPALLLARELRLLPPVREPPRMDPL